MAPAVPLLVDLDGALLEAAWANLLLVTADGALVTPPLDGRILPGVTRARTLERARALDLAVRERPCTLADRAPPPRRCSPAAWPCGAGGPRGPVGRALGA